MPAAICHHRKPEIIFSLFLLLAVSPPSQTMVAILKVMNSSILSCYNACSMNATCVLHKACLLHAFFPHDWGWCWMQMPWQGDWQCVCKFLHRSPETLALNDWVSVHMTRWSPVSRPGKASDKKKKKTHWPLHAPAWSNILLFLRLLIEENQWSSTRWYLPLSVTSLFFCATSGLRCHVLVNEQKPDCVSIWI